MNYHWRSDKPSHYFSLAAACSCRMDPNYVTNEKGDIEITITSTAVSAKDGEQVESGRIDFTV
jgi:hypothetical protein